MYSKEEERREKETLEMPLGSLAEQFSTRIAESSSVVAGNFPWLMTASSLSLLWGCCVLGFFLCVCVCVFGVVFGWGIFAFVFAACLLSFSFPVSHHSSWR